MQEFLSDNEIYNPFETESSTQDHLCDSSTEYMKHRQEQDLLGLTLQTPKNSLPDNEMNTPNTLLQAVPEEKIVACPLHNALLAGLLADEVTSDGTASDSKSMLMPMDRYLAEGLGERYALLNLRPSDAEGDWARYSGCLCRA